MLESEKDLKWATECSESMQWVSATIWKKSQVWKFCSSCIGCKNTLLDILLDFLLLVISMNQLSDLQLSYHAVMNKFVIPWWNILQSAIKDRSQGAWWGHKQKTWCKDKATVAAHAREPIRCYFESVWRVCIILIWAITWSYWVSL